MTAEELIRTLENDPLERLKWHVLRFFGVLPGSARALELSDEDFIICGAHMVLDGRLRSAASATGEAAQNSAFDNERFAGLAEEGV